jgi:diguanylate cyclase (GGDEF)-like protein
MRVDRHDELTGLLSQHGFEQQLREVAAHAAPDETAWVFVADLDRLKDLNDLHGHGAVDEYLKAVAAALRGALAPSHALARLGGDEFGAILRDMAMGDARTAGEEARAAVESLGHPLKGTITVGIAGWLPAHEPADGAMRRADTALYSAKNAGGNRIHVSGTEPGAGTPPWHRSER